MRVRHDMFSDTAPVQESSQTPPRPGKSRINHDIAVISVDHHGVEQPARKQRASMNPISNLAELSGHGSRQHEPPRQGEGLSESTGLTVQQQHQVAMAIKNAREMALLPFAGP